MFNIKNSLFMKEKTIVYRLCNFITETTAKQRKVMKGLTIVWLCYNGDFQRVSIKHTLAYITSACIKCVEPTLFYKVLSMSVKEKLTLTLVFLALLVWNRWISCREFQGWDLEEVQVLNAES